MSEDSDHLIEVVVSDGPDRGVFATVDIPLGTRIFAEEAILQYVEESDDEDLDPETILGLFEDLPECQQEAYLELDWYVSEDLVRITEEALDQSWEDMSEQDRIVLAIFAVNNFGNVYLVGSRINHSCVPNTCFAYNTELKKGTFHAIRSITAGEELTVSYIESTYASCLQRISALGKWGFICSCPACEQTPQASLLEEKRVQLSDLNRRLEKSLGWIDSSLIEWDEVLDVALDMIAVQVSEGSINRELGLSYHFAAMSCVMLGDARQALDYALEELCIEFLCIGDDHVDFMMEFDVTMRLRQSVVSSTPIEEAIVDWFMIMAELDKYYPAVQGDENLL